MDKLRGIGWVGGIYNKFEELCHEMDNIVNQDTVKYVENQAQNAGKSMTRLYSDTIHPLKHEDQGIALRRSTTIDASFESKASLQEDHINSVGKLSHVEPVAVDPTEKQLDHTSNELSLPVKLITRTSVDVLDGAESGTISQQVSDAMKTTRCDVSIEGDAIIENASGSDVSELTSLGEEESFGDSLANKFIDCKDKISSKIDGEVSLTMLVNDIEFQSPEKETRVSDDIIVDVAEKQLECAFSVLCLVDQPGNPNSVDSLLRKQYVTSEQVADFLNDTKPEVNLEEYATIEKPSAPEVSGLVSPFEKESSGASLLNKFIDFNDKEMYSKADLPPATLVHFARKPSASDVLELIFPGEEESFGSSLVNEIVNCDDKKPSVVQSDNSSATLIQGDQKAREVKNHFAGDSECVSDASGDITSSRMTSSVICSEEDMTEVGVDSSRGSVFKEFCLPENSLENSHSKAFICHDSVNVVELVCHNVHSSSIWAALLSNEKELEAAVSVSSSNELSRDPLGPPVDDSIDDISISSMETIELYDEVKLEDICVISDSTTLYAVSRIMSRRKSYKKRILDALTSRKRLSKEYEQLAIWFGDTDMGPVHDHFQTLRPSSSTTTSEPKNMQTELLCDSDWEIL